MWERSATWEATMFMRTSLSGEIFPSFYPFAHGVQSLGCDVCLSVTDVNTLIEDLVEHLADVTLTDENTKIWQINTTDDVGMEIPSNMIMQVAPSGGQHFIFLIWFKCLFQQHLSM